MFDTAQALNLSSSGSRAAAPDGSNPSTGLDHVQNWRHQSNAGSAFGASAEPPAADSLQVQPEGNALRSAYSTSSIGSHSRNRKNVSGSTAVTPTLAGGLGGLAGIEERALEVETFLSEQSPLRSWVRWMAKSGLKEWCIPCGLMAVVLVKWCAGLGGWSGRGMPPKFGDFEAQRHWLELTLHLPYSDWYWYDKDWWGLDYPPLTAWISLLCAKVATLVPGLSPSLALDTSRGSESALLAVFMRSTVLILDLLLYVPSVLFFLNRRLAGRSLRTRSVASISVLLQPALILIDSGHFQYNSVMLGLCALCFALLYSFLPNPGASVATAGFAGSSPPLLQTSSAQENAARTKIKSVTRQLSYQYILAAVTFSCALGFKQMALYFAPAIFSVMLGRCWGLKHIRFDKGFALFAGLSAAVIATFFLMLLPWLTSLSQLQQILIRVFPLARGLFEDKVANLWCFLSCLPVPQRFKLRNVMSISSLARLSLLTTLIAILPTCVHLFWAGMQTVSIETSIDADTRARNSGASVAGSVKGDASLAGASLRDEALPSGTRRTRKSSVAGSDAGTERMSIFSGRTAGGTAVRRPPVLSNYLGDQRPVTMVVPSPAAAILPYALLSVSMAFFLFGFQTHEKSILIPLLPLTLLMSSKGDAYSGGAGATDWEWAVLSNNLATFSMWPLLRKDGLIVQYVVITLIWNWAIGYEPFAHLREARKLFVGWFSAAVTAAILALHAAEVALPALIPSSIWTPIISRYPDLFPVLNVLLCAPCFGLVWLWSMKRQMEVGFAAGLDSLSLLQGLLRKPQTKGVRKGS
ncbi:glycosyltransferase family 57 protein [Tilletiaria anomala UBC 951]|uniref:Alpha-1,3-glucosyltransferase n=1 Tax=Tilletiaria anomala (strain ATCC 24038 / CBS 436.72 / UBC 951) TaxID=1037660 RepID=A0A066VXZ1_TILAU|nr:glycosyltransferase family 57 protein [Tilletiaria anomala UBC 951]KDN46607.1 glycosyltransferase family 57 protein [Tilletiaria anomala UBC 951]